MHECLLTAKKLPTTVYNFAKRLIDHGIHPPTLLGAGCVYFPDALGNAMLLEPTESETKESLDEIITIFRRTYYESMADTEYVNLAPHKTKTNKIPEQARVIGEASHSEII